MASIIHDVPVDAAPDVAWKRLRDFASVDELVPGFVTDCRLDADGTRVVTFFNGAVAREALLGIDDDARRLAYAVVEGLPGCTHHSAAAQIAVGDDGTTRFVWTADVLPDELADVVGPMMAAGVEAVRAGLGRSEGND